MIYKVDTTFCAYPEIKNKKINWHASDDLESYKKNLKHKKDLLKSYCWIDTEIEYNFNSNGFRSEEFEDNSIPSAIFLGCSNTLGTGIPIEKSWTYLVAKELNVKMYNLGLAGGSNDSAFRFAQAWIPRLKPKYVFLLSPNKIRNEFINEKNDIILFGEWGNTLRSNSFIKGNMYQYHLNKIKNIMAIENIVRINNSELVVLDSMQYLDYRNMRCFGMQLPDLSRDLYHPGVISNAICADKFLNEMQRKTNGF
jgi:hypothetical protein